MSKSEKRNVKKRNGKKRRGMTALSEWQRESYRVMRKSAWIKL